MPTSKSLNKVNPELRLRVELCLSDVPSLWVESAYRSPAQQQRLYDLYLAGKGPPANRPGTSMHEKGLAVDLACRPEDSGARARAIKKHGLYQPYRTREPWHMELDPKRKPVEVPDVVTASKTVKKPAVAIRSTPSGNGYWIVSSDGGVYSFGDAGFYGAMAGKRLAAPIVNFEIHPSGKGYWLLGGDGGVFAFGEAKYHTTNDNKDSTEFFD